MHRTSGHGSGRQRGECTHVDCRQHEDNGDEHDPHDRYYGDWEGEGAQVEGPAYEVLVIHDAKSDGDGWRVGFASVHLHFLKNVR